MPVKRVAMLHLKTFGGLSVAVDGSPVTGAAVQRKTLALLALLATTKQGVSRDKLIAYLWPESDAAHGRNLLKQACYALRRDLHAPDLLLGATELRLNPAVISSDVRLFDEALERGDQAAAVALYGGPFLDGFFLSETEEFERWVESERTRLAKRVFRALEALAREASAARHRRRRRPGCGGLRSPLWSWASLSWVWSRWRSPQRARTRPSRSSPWAPSVTTPDRTRPASLPRWPRCSRPTSRGYQGSMS